MTAIWSTAFLTTLKAGWAPVGATVKMYLFPQAPSLDPGGEGEESEFASPYAAINHVTDLATTLGWGPYIEGPTISMTVDVAGSIHFVTTVDFNLPDIFPTTRIAAFAFTLGGAAPTTDQIMYLSDSALPGEGLVLGNQDGFVPAIDTGVSENVLFSWTPLPGTAPVDALPSPTEGKLLLLKGPPDFEPARSQHVWIYPQRVNLIANPSFELTTNYWRTNGTKSQTTSPPYGGGNFAGRFTGTNPLVVESNTFPLNYGRRSELGWTIQLWARGTGELKVGLISWDGTFQHTASNWGVAQEQVDKKIMLSPSTWTHVKVIRGAGETNTGMLRLETDGSVLDIDQVCVEPGILPVNGEDWPYFDGSIGFGERADFSWYGGPSREHTSYSCWYNNRDATFGRLFSWKVTQDDEEPGGVLSDDDMLKQGLVFQWVPAGTPVFAHLDVLYPGDPQSPLAAVSGTVLAYGTDGAGVARPW